jgi:hypothetical protein
MSVASSSPSEQDETIKRQTAERLQADLADLVLFLVSAYVSGILDHLPIKVLPPDVVRDISKLAVVYSSMMDWANEALEHGGRPPDRQPGAGVRVYDFEAAAPLGPREAYVGAILMNIKSIEAAAAQLARARPNSWEWYEAKRVLDHAIKGLQDASTCLRPLAAVKATEVPLLAGYAHGDLDPADQADRLPSRQEIEILADLDRTQVRLEQPQLHFGGLTPSGRVAYQEGPAPGAAPGAG